MISQTDNIGVRTVLQIRNETEQSQYELYQIARNKIIISLQNKRPKRK